MTTSRRLGDPAQIISGAELRQMGLSPGAIRAQLHARRWRRWGQAIALHSGPLSREQRWAVARIHGGPQAVLTAFTVAQAGGLTGWDRSETHILVPRGARVIRPCPVPLVVHRVREWARVRCQTGVAMQRRADALFVAAAAFDTPRPACGIIAAAVQQRVVDVHELRAAIAQLPRVRHRRVLLASIDDIEQGAQALSEIDFVQLCRRHGLPRPVQQAVRIEPSGRRRYLDATWRRADGRYVVVEIDGALHLLARRWWDDQLRQNELALADALVLRFPSAVVRAEEALVADQLRRALRISHAPGTPRPILSMTKRMEGGR